MDPTFVTLVGDRIRSTRRDRGFSVGALAAAARIGKGSLSEIEQGLRNPTLGTLYSLTTALDVPLSWLLAQQVGAEASSDALASRLLEVDGSRGSTVEVYSIVLTAGLVHRAEAHGPGIREHMLVTRGRIAAGPVGEEVVCGEDEAVAWTSDRPHTYRAVGPAAARAVLTIRWPGGMH